MKTTLRTSFIAFAVAAAALALTACNTAPMAPAEPAHVAEAPIKKSIVEMEFELLKLEMEAKKIETMAIIKFADESKSEYAKGVVSGLLSGGRPSASQAGGGRGSMIQAKAQQDEIALRREEIASRDSWWNRGLQVFDRGLGFAQYSKGLSQQRYMFDGANTQTRYMFDAYRGTQQDAYGFAGSAYGAGSNATLGGFSAGSTAAATGAAAAVAAAAATE